jgi:hypothetical protein
VFYSLACFKTFSDRDRTKFCNNLRGLLSLPFHLNITISLIYISTPCSRFHNRPIYFKGHTRKGLCSFGVQKNSVTNHSLKANISLTQTITRRYESNCTLPISMTVTCSLLYVHDLEKSQPFLRSGLSSPRHLLCMIHATKLYNPCSWYGVFKSHETINTL